MSQGARTPALTPLALAGDEGEFGGKAAQLSAALCAGLPVPGGFAVRWTAVEAVAAGRLDIAPELAGLERGPWAVRSSAIGEDSDGASFAGAHLSVLGVVGAPALEDAVRRVHASARDEAAIAYREHSGLDVVARMAVVVQEMVAADVAGVLFTRHPVTGERERVIEASWGLGEMVVSGQVTPDNYRVSSEGVLVDYAVGEKDIALRLLPDGSVEEYDVAAGLVEARCLDDQQLAALHHLAAACDLAYGSSAHDIEFAFAGPHLHLLQRRPITHA
ncbi:MAG TPA: PEP/pyruvate-binding domain-containing protein [Nocardioides sp.]|nr:PEP/pyruvate-binding domain-containing protein [Nocardioides sp.]